MFLCCQTGKINPAKLTAFTVDISVVKCLKTRNYSPTSRYPATSYRAISTIWLLSCSACCPFLNSFPPKILLKTKLMRLNFCLISFCFHLPCLDVALKTGWGPVLTPDMA